MLLTSSNFQVTSSTEQQHRTKAVFEKERFYMIERYEDVDIAFIWSDRAKVDHWQKVELAVIETGEELGKIPTGTKQKIREPLEKNPCDLNWWKEREKDTQHDLNAWLEERLRFIPPELQEFWHAGLTSFDTEDPGLALTLKDSVISIQAVSQRLQEKLRNKAVEYRYLPMFGETHGQDAELQSLGKLFLTWYQELTIALKGLLESGDLACKYGKLSGAIGNYSGITPAVEEKALAKLGLEPFYGATQIIPRILYAPLASALADLATVVDKISSDIRLGARSPNPYWQEPFGKKAKGSSAMPHKRNPIRSEKVEGMARMARAYAGALRENIKTCRERSIEQSSVERVFWQDLFQVTNHAIKTMTSVIKGLVIYPDNILKRIADSQEVYASNEAKEFLARHGQPFGIDREDAYRIVQLAAFNAFEPHGSRKECRRLTFHTPQSISGTIATVRQSNHARDGISTTIMCSLLRHSVELEASVETIESWKQSLQRLFLTGPEASRMREEWSKIFEVNRVFERENILFEKVFGIK